MHIYIYIYTAGCSSYPMLWISMDMYRQSMAEAGPVISTSVALVADRKNKKIPHKKSASTYRESCWLPISLISKTWLFPRSIAIICFLFHLFFFWLFLQGDKKKWPGSAIRSRGLCLCARELFVTEILIDWAPHGHTAVCLWVRAATKTKERRVVVLLFTRFSASLFSLSLSAPSSFSFSSSSRVPSKKPDSVQRSQPRWITCDGLYRVFCARGEIHLEFRTRRAENKHVKGEKKNQWKIIRSRRKREWHCSVLYIYIWNEREDCLGTAGSLAMSLTPLAASVAWCWLPCGLPSWYYHRPCDSLASPCSSGPILFFLSPTHNTHAQRNVISFQKGRNIKKKRV